MANNMIDQFNSYYFGGTPESEALNKAYSDLYGQAYRAKQKNPTDPRYFYFPSEQSATKLTEWQKQKAANMGIKVNQTDPALLAMWFKSIGTQPGSVYKSAEDYRRFSEPYLKQIEQARELQRQQESQYREFELEQQRQIQKDKAQNRLGEFTSQATRGLGSAYEDYIYGPPSQQEQTMRQAQVLLNTSGLQWRYKKLEELEQKIADMSESQRLNNPRLYEQYMSEISELQKDISSAYSNAEQYIRQQQNFEQRMEDEKRTRRSPEWDQQLEYNRAMNARYAQQQQEQALREMQSSATRGFYTTPTQSFQSPFAYNTWASTPAPAQPAAVPTLSPNYAAMAQQIGQAAQTANQMASPAANPANPYARPVPQRPNRPPYGNPYIRPVPQRPNRSPYAFQEV